jgi:hypothetical protein
VADSESDIYEVFAEPRGEPVAVDWLVRLCQDRSASAASDSAAERPFQQVRQLVAASDLLFTEQITVRGRQAKVACEKRKRRQTRQTRTALVEVRATRLTLRPPGRPDRSLPAVTAHVIQVVEQSPPAGEPAVEWLLATTLPIETEEQVRQAIEYYTVRWGIELLFRTLKSGCRVEERRFEFADHFLPCLAVYLIVAWRTLFVCRLGRSCPDLECEAVFEPAEWKSAWMVVRKKRPPKKPPRLGEMVELIAELGGYVPQHGNRPGPQTVWLGLQRMHDLALAWETFGPETKQRR